MISVVVPAKDASNTIRECLAAVLSQENIDDDYEVILVDDGSTDDTSEIAESMRVRVIRQDNAGPGAARNAGVQASKGEIIAFTDADCVPTADWLHHLIQPFLDSETVGVKGTYLTKQRGLMPRFVQAEYSYKYRRVAAHETIDFIDTYSAAYRRGPFIDNGGFEESMPAAQDAEFSFRLARKGYRLGFAPQATVYHLHSQHLGQYLRRKYRNGYWRLFMSRWLPEKTFSNSHTPPTMHWQILLLGLGLGLVPLSFFWPILGWILIPLLVLFMMTALPFLKHIWLSDRAIILGAPVYLLFRAGALGVGVFHGLISPPRVQPRTYTGLSRSERFFKRLLDIIVALICLFLFSPLLLFAGIVIKLDTSGPIFYKQERAGENGKPFWLVKLRTMIDGADNMDPEPARDPFEGMVIKIPDDPRITRVGRILRRWSVDEVPQFWNVLRGDMSLVGPRPEQTWVVAQYDDKQRRRLAVKPGITGPMQVGGRAELDMQTRQVLEVEYINTYSLWKDIRILILTIPAVIKGEGAL